MAKEPPPKKMKLEGPKDEETNPNEPKTEEVMRAAGFIPRVLAWPPPWAKAEAAEHAEDPETEEATLETMAEDAEEVEEAVKEEHKDEEPKT